MMEESRRSKVAFHLTGRLSPGLEPLGGGFRPALLAGFSDLSSLRYDFPVVLNRSGGTDRAVLSLSRLVDEAVGSIADPGDREKIARHGHALEQVIRGRLAGAAPDDFSMLWNSSVSRLAKERGREIEESAHLLWRSFDAEGVIADAGADLPFQLFRHAWRAVRAERSAAFVDRAGRLLKKLRDILKADEAASVTGRSPERLKAGVGPAFAASFDFEALSQTLRDAKPHPGLSEKRRERIRSLIEILENQRFYKLEPGGSEPFAFAFERCSDALAAYGERHAEAVELVKTLKIAELEINGEYRDSIHDVLFEGFGERGLSANELALLPDYLVCLSADTLEPDEAATLMDLLAAGMPVKIVARTDDVLGPYNLAEGRVCLGPRARQMVDAAIGMKDVFVLQSGVSELYKLREPILRGLAYSGPAMFSIFSGDSLHSGGLPHYLVSAAATESRVFPSIVYDPSTGPDWASRTDVSGNPEPPDDWPMRTLSYEDEDLQMRTEELPFTMADFAALDRRLSRHFALTDDCDPGDEMLAVPEALAADTDELPDAVPYITLVDGDNLLRRAIFDHRILKEVRRCLSIWHSLQELGGFRALRAGGLPTGGDAPVETEIDIQPASAEEGAAKEEKADAAPPQTETEPGDPYIETARCTSCNECVELNGKMFAYDENKQAYIADPDAGTFRELVEAAESCQVSIIHPGLPRNPKEPGLEDLIRRAEDFN